MTDKLKPYMAIRTDFQHLEQIINTFLERHPQYSLYQIIPENLYEGTMANIIFELEKVEVKRNDR